jgi:hypothetical protein
MQMSRFRAKNVSPLRLPFSGTVPDSCANQKSVQLSYNPRNPRSDFYLLQHRPHWREILHDVFVDVSGRGGMWAVSTLSRQTPWFRMTGAEN